MVQLFNDVFVYDPGEISDPSAVSREHRIESFPEGICAIAGGKLTTYRRMAEVARDCRVPMLSVDCDGNVMELVPLLAGAGARALLYHASFAKTVAEIRRELPDLRLLLQVDDGSGEPLLDGSLAIDFTQPARVGLYSVLMLSTGFFEEILGRGLMLVVLLSLLTLGGGCGQAIFRSPLPAALVEQAEQEDTVNWERLLEPEHPPLTESREKTSETCLKMVLINAWSLFSLAFLLVQQQRYSAQFVYLSPGPRRRWQPIPSYQKAPEWYRRYPG